MSEPLIEPDLNDLNDFLPHLSEPMIVPNLNN